MAAERSATQGVPASIDPMGPGAGLVNGLRSFLAELGASEEVIEQTPQRWVAAMKEMALTPQPMTHMRSFCDGYSQLVVVTGIRFTSVCEHHLLPFTGTVDVGYLPTSKVVGLSKLARLVVAVATGLQLQERMTDAITRRIMHDGELKAAGAGCIVTATHSCMACRGARQPDARCVTSSMVGSLREDATLRAEFLSLVRRPNP